VAQVEVERVIVTGSNIPTAEEVGPNPVLTINRDLIEKSGERTAEELIRNTTVAGALACRCQSGSDFRRPAETNFSGQRKEMNPTSCSTSRAKD
jgi:iron complex outermembrane receptor protein